VEWETFVKEYRAHIMTSYAEPFPLVVTDADGVYLVDAEGRRYLDFWAGIATVNAGHQNPRVQAAVERQLGRLVHCASQSYYTLPPLELAKTLTTLAPFEACKATFLTSGSEATDVAVKLVRRYTGRHEIITLQGAYHGQTYGSRSISTHVAGYSKASAMGPWLPGVVHAPAPYCYRCSLGDEYPGCGLQCAKMVEDTINFATSRDVAAFVAEPILGVGGIVTPPDGYFREVKRVLDAHGVLLVLDEVQTGLGRTGRLWGSESYQVTPDVITLAKALGNGWPIAAVVAADPIGDAFEPGDHFSTWGAHPVMCAAAKASLDVIVERRLWDNAARRGEQLRRGLEELRDGCDVIGEVRGKGLMIGVEIVETRATKAPSVERCSAIRAWCARRGLIVGQGGFWSNVLRIQPPLTIGPEHVEAGLRVLSAAVRDDAAG
jgi:4-aminobutyrate aminotransferase-like enzyme